MTENTKDKRGMSAAQACRVQKRAKAPRQISEPRTYTLHRSNGEIVLENGTRKQVRDLCPGLREGLVTRRLESGERDIDRLRRPPEAPATRKRKLQPIPMYHRKGVLTS